MARPKTFLKSFPLRLSEADERRIDALKSDLAPEVGVLSTAALLRYCIAQIATQRSIALS